MWLFYDPFSHYFVHSPRTKKTAVLLQTHSCKKLFLVTIYYYNKEYVILNLLANCRVNLSMFFRLLKNLMSKKNLKTFLFLIHSYITWLNIPTPRKFLTKQNKNLLRFHVPIVSTFYVKKSWLNKRNNKYIHVFTWKNY